MRIHKFLGINKSNYSVLYLRPTKTLEEQLMRQQFLGGNLEVFGIFTKPDPAICSSSQLNAILVICVI